MKKIAVVGAGNVGKAVAKALELSADMELCGFVSRKTKPVRGFENITVAKSIFDLPQKPNGAIICLPSRLVEKAEAEILEEGIFTADCFDMHEKLAALRQKLSQSAEKGKVSAIIGAGWDPGLDSVIRTLMYAALPRGMTFTDFGPGMSMGHSAAARNTAGVRDAISFTLPLGWGKHERKIYAVLEPDADKNAVEHEILNDEYFEHDRCSIEFVDSLVPFYETGHGAKISRFGNAAGCGGNRIGFELFGDNPSLTAQFLVAAMRAAFLQNPGAYFVTEIPPKDFCGSDETKFI